MLKKWILFISVLFVSTASFAETQYLKLGKGKVIAYEHYVKDVDGPTLILLPGVNRALYMQDRSVQLLSEQGWNLLIPSLSAHPLSIQGLAKDEVPYFVYDQNIRVKELAADIDSLVVALKINKGIPVTLSYSSSIGAYLNPQRFPHIIETVPLGVATESDPDGAKTAATWESWLRLNPFMAPIWIRQSRDLGYAKHWGGIVDATLKDDAEFYGANPRVSDIKAGYVTIARAVEDFKFMDWDFKSEARTRDFVFAEKENPLRLKNQIEVLRNYIAADKPVRVIVVTGSGHILPSERPAIYAGVMSLLATQPRKSAVQFAFVNTLENLSALEWQDRGALENWMNKNSQ